MEIVLLGDGRYAQRLKECQGKLVRVRVSEPVCHQLEKTDLLAWLAKDHVTGA